MTYHPRPETLQATEALKARVMELYAMGQTPREIAEVVDRTPQRVTQIVLSFGYGYRKRRR